MNGCLTVAELCVRTGAPRRVMERWIREWLESGDVERVNGGYRASAEWREAFGRIRDDDAVPLTPDELDEALGHCKPGPQKAAA